MRVWIPLGYPPRWTSSTVERRRRDHIVRGSGPPLRGRLVSSAECRGMWSVEGYVHHLRASFAALISRRTKFAPKGAIFSLALIATVGAIAMTRLFWMNQWSPDTVWQYQQALTGRYNDQHPPAMAALWSLLAPRELDGKFIIALQVTIFWVIVVLVISSGREVPYSRKTVAIFAFLAPTSISLVGVVWKDVHLALAWSLAAALLVYRVRSDNTHVWIVGFVCVLLMYGVLVRYNAFLAVPPLVLVTMLGKPWSRGPLATAIAYVLIAGFGIITLQVLDNRLFRAETSATAHLSLATFDMAGITVVSGRNAFPYPISAAEFRDLHSCYSPDRWDGLVYGNSPCRWTLDRLNTYQVNGGNVARSWIYAIAADRGAYIRHRLAYANRFYCVLHCQPEVYDAGFFYAGVTSRAPQSRPLPPTYHSDWLISTYQYYLDHSWRWHLLNTWLAAAAALAIAAAAFALDLKERYLIFAMSLTSLFYLGGYTLVGIASDQRYAYPSFLLAAVGFATVMTSPWHATRCFQMTSAKSPDEGISAI
jgi:hypothetical protein